VVIEGGKKKLKYFFRNKVKIHKQPKKQLSKSKQINTQNF